MSAHRGLTVAVACAVAVLWSLSAADAVTWTQKQKIVSSDGVAGDAFGYSVGVDGTIAVSGAFGDDGGYGSAPAFEKSGGVWSQTARFTVLDPTPSDHLGYAASISGTTAILGAYGHTDYGTNSGAAYIMDKTGGAWGYTTKLEASDEASGDFFGISVGINGTTAIVGAVNKWSGFGGAYIFEKSGGVWSQTGERACPDSTGYDAFGNSVAVSGNYAVISATNHQHGGVVEGGSAYVFKKVGADWVFTTELLASDRAAHDVFGRSVSISGSRILIGADGKNSNTGAVYVFDNIGGTWTQTKEILNPGGSANDHFGGSVSLSGSTALIGAYNDADCGTNTGSAFLYDYTGGDWVLNRRLWASDGVAGDQFGVSVSLSGLTAVIGANGDDGGRGSAYVFEASPVPEPATLTLVGMGAMGILGGIRRRRSTRVVSGTSSGHSGKGATAMRTSIACLLAVLFMGLGRAEAYVWTSLDRPGGANTTPLGIDGSNVVGSFNDGGVTHGFLYNGTSWTNIVEPGGSFTTAAGISGNRIVGSGPSWNSYIMTLGGPMTFFTYPSAVLTNANDIDGDAVAGNYYPYQWYSFGFTCDCGLGNWSQVGRDIVWSFTELHGISGNVRAGSYIQGGVEHGFTSIRGFPETQWDYPGAQQTGLLGIEGDKLVGWYNDGSKTHGAYYDGSGWTALDYPGATGTWVSDISGSVVVGYYADATSAIHGFEMNLTQTATPEPCTILLLGTGALGAFGYVRRRGSR